MDKTDKIDKLLKKDNLDDNLKKSLEEKKTILKEGKTIQK